MISSLNFVSIKQILGGKLPLFGVNWVVLGGHHAMGVYWGYWEPLKWGVGWDLCNTFIFFQL